MKRSLVLLLFFLIFVIGGFVWWRGVISPVDVLDKEPLEFVIEKGEPVRVIARRLREKGLVRDPVAFFLVVKKLGFAKKIEAGHFELDRSMGAYELALALTHGVRDLRVTIPEGWRSEQIFERLKSQEWENEAIWSEYTSGSWRAFEGRLFPDTYFFSRAMGPDDVLERFLDNFDKKIVKGLAAEISSSDLDLDEILILASIVEREVKEDSDRAVVAGILLNRLEKGMGLDIDATVQYAVASIRCSAFARATADRQNPNIQCEDWWPKVTAEDLKIDSDFNTYLYAGLPPMPIANPSLVSIKAVLNPTKTDYWYYLSDSEGKIHYARTLEEQNRNIRKFLISN